MSALLVSCCLLALVQAHIHSQKVKNIKGGSLTLSTWVSALVSSALVGACGVFPLIVNRYVQLDSSCKDQLAFKGILSFSVGGLLGDVFLHLLPEAYGTSTEVHGLGIGLWVLAGLLSFLAVEKMMTLTEKSSENLRNENITTSTPDSSDSNCGTSMKADINGLTQRVLAGESVNGINGHHPSSSSSSSEPFQGHQQARQEKWFDKDVSGYLNLVANSTDNFTHGLAIAASYVASPAVGVLTTLAILCHEIPHEIGDFAILLNSGFSLKQAAKAQILTGFGGLVGVIAGLTAEHLSNASSWLLPFTAGGFLYIALVSIAPDLLESGNLWESTVELLALSLGIFIMALVTIIEKKSCGHMPPHLVGT